MPTRQPRRRGTAHRGWPELHKSRGADGLMESEALYMVLVVLAQAAGEVPDAEIAEILIDHYGDLQEAKRGLSTLADNVAGAFAAIQAWLDDEPVLLPDCRCGHPQVRHDYAGACWIVECNCHTYRGKPWGDDEEDDDDE